MQGLDKVTGKNIGKRSKPPHAAGTEAGERPGKANGRRLFTIVMDFEGTTSVSQFRTTSVPLAVKLWLGELRKPKAYALTDRQRSRLLKGYERYDANFDLPPASLGLQSAWCQTISAVDKGIAVLNVIETK